MPMPAACGRLRHRSGIGCGSTSYYSRRLFDSKSVLTMMTTPWTRRTLKTKGSDEVKAWRRRRGVGA